MAKQQLFADSWSDAWARPMLSRRVFSMVMLAALALASPLVGQVATGNVEGRLVAAGVPIAEALVTVTGPALPGSRSALSDGQGQFRVAALAVGTYTLRIVRIGFRPVAVESVTVHLGRTTSIGEVSLEATAVTLAELTITAGRVLIDPSSATIGANLASDAFTLLPTARNFRDIVTLAPQANASAMPGDGVNIAGGSGPENAWFIDGTDMSDVVAGATSVNLPYNFVREIEVRAGGYEAEFGRSMGAAVNVVTQSGGKDWHGQVFGFFTNDALTALPRYAGSATSRNAFKEYDVGGSVGGPIVRDRLWVFAAYDPTVHSEQVVVRGIAAPAAYDRAHLFAGKLSWAPSSRTGLQFTVLGDPARGHSLSRAQAFDSVGNVEAVLADVRSGGRVYSVSGWHELGRTIRLEGSAATVTRNDETLPGTTFGYSTAGYEDLTTRVVEGGFGGIYRSNGRRTALRGAVILSERSHTAKVGVEYEDNFLDFDQNGGWDGTTGGYIQRQSPMSWVWTRFRTAAKLHNRVSTAYVQDGWRIHPRLSVNAGLRWEGQTLIAADGNTAQQIMNQWQPRLGFVYQPGVPGTQRVFGSYGRFYEQLPLNIMAAYGNAGGYTQTAYSQDPRTDTTGGVLNGGNPFVASIQARRDLEGQSFDELSLGYERLIGRSVRVGVRGQLRRLNWAIEDAVNPDSLYFVIGNPGRGDLSFTPRAERRYSALTVTLDRPLVERAGWQLSYTLSRAHGNYDGLYDYQQTSALPNVGASFDVPFQYANGTGLLGNDRTHVLKAAGSYRLGLGLTSGMFASVMSGVPRNEFGAPQFTGHYSFLQPRGSNGRTPTITDISLRLVWAVPVAGGTRVRPSMLLDVFHLANRRETVAVDDTHYLAMDESGNQTSPNPNYGKGTYFQLPRSVRLGMVVDF